MIPPGHSLCSCPDKETKRKENNRLHLPSHLKDHPYTCARVEDQGRVGPQQSWLDRVRPKEHKEWKAKVVFSLSDYTRNIHS
jgi:hypothetical protein